MKSDKVTPTKEKNLMFTYADIITKTKNRLRSPLALFILCVGWNCPDALYAGRCVDVFKQVEFSSLEKASITAGKMPHIKAEVDKARARLQGKRISCSTAQLLDGRLDNYEFYGLWIDKSVKSDPQAELYITTPGGDKLTFRYDGIENVDGCFVQVEYEQMQEMIGKGLEMGTGYNAAQGKKAQFLRALDAQAGKIEGLSMSFTPKFEILMGFTSEKEMRNILARTQHITIDYYPNPKDAAPWVENDFRVTYHLGDKKKVEKYVGNVPLSILK